MKIIWENKNKNEESKILSNHFKAVISFQLCILGIGFVSLLIYFAQSQIIPLVGTLIVSAAVSIINAIQVLNGRQYINPFYKSINKN